MLFNVDIKKIISIDTGIILLFFFLPFKNNITSILTILLCLITFFDKSVSYKEIIKNKIILFPISLYLLHILGLIYTSNFKYAGLDLEIKLPLLICPILLLLYREKINIDRIFKGFILGCFLASVIILFICYKKYLITEDPRSFFYDNMAVFMHTSYFAMYICTAIAIILFKIQQNQKNNFFNLLSILYFLIIVFLLASRSGLLIIFLIFFVYFIYILFKLKWVQILLFSLFVSSIYLGYESIPKVTSSRFDSIKVQNTYRKPNKIESSDTSIGRSNYSKINHINQQDHRLSLLEISIYLIKKNWMLGVGTGDVKDKLISAYKYYNFKVGIEKEYNCHNQFAQFFVAFGVVGFLIFIIGILIPLFWYGYHKMNYLHLTFVGISLLSFLFESVLETKAGVEYFTLFNSLFIVQSITNFYKKYE